MFNHYLPECMFARERSKVDNDIVCRISLTQHNICHVLYRVFGPGPKIRLALGQKFSLQLNVHSAATQPSLTSPFTGRFHSEYMNYFSVTSDLLSRDPTSAALM